MGVCSACLGNQKFYDKKGAKVCAKEKVLFTTAFSCCIKNLVVLRALANRCDHRLVVCPLVFVVMAGRILIYNMASNFTGRNFSAMPVRSF